MKKNRKDELAKAFVDNGGFLRYSEIIKKGFHNDQISALVKNKTIEKVNHGLYKLEEYEPDNNHDSVYVTRHVKNGVVCLISALSFHDITDQIPARVHLAVPKGSWDSKSKWNNKPLFPKYGLYHYSRESWEAGIIEVEESGNTFKVYNVAKTIADCFKFRSRIGTDVIIGAIKEGLREKKLNPNDILKYARINRVEKIVWPILQGILWPMNG